MGTDEEQRFAALGLGDSDQDFGRSDLYTYAAHLKIANQVQIAGVHTIQRLLIYHGLPRLLRQLCIS